MNWVHYVFVILLLSVDGEQAAILSKEIHMWIRLFKRSYRPDTRNPHDKSCSISSNLDTRIARSEQFKEDKTECAERIETYVSTWRRRLTKKCEAYRNPNWSLKTKQCNMNETKNSFELGQMKS